MRAVTVVTTIEKRPIAPVITPTHPPLWMIQEDAVLFGGVRPCAPCPAVVVMKNDSHAFMDQQWQYDLAAKNYAMELEDIYLLLDCHLAFANQTGFRCNPKADYFHNRDLKYKPPNLDKVRSCVRNVVTGTEQYSLLQTVKDVATLIGNVGKRALGFRQARSSFASLLTTANNVLNVWTFDSQQPPPLKPGRSYPGDISKVNPDDYLYTPQTHPWMFVVANIVNKSGDVVQFPRGGLYPWTHDLTPYSFMPLISNHGYGDVLYDLSKLRKIRDDYPIPSPYSRPA